MSGSTRGKKGKQRNNSKKNANQNQSLGKKCVTELRNGAVYEGLFHAYNKQMDLSFNIVHRVQTEAQNGSDHQLNSFPKEDDIVNEVIFKFDTVVCAAFEDVDLDFAIQDINERNGETNNQPRGAKNFEKLEPWNGGGDSGDADPLTLGGLENSGIDGTNGWDADDMFKANEEKYGVKSDYDSSLSKYTMPLKIEDENPESVSRANRLAQEIEGGSEYRQRIEVELDDGTTEEDKFSAVTRENNSRRENRGSRDYHDRDHDHYAVREKERGDRDRDQGPPPYRNRDYGDRNRGRGSRIRDYPPRNQPGGYPGGAGHSRSMGPGGPPGGDRRSQMSMQPTDGQNKFRNMQTPHLPPRFTRTGSGGHSRDDERARQNDNAAMHPSYQPKGQRHPRNQGRMPGGRPWSNSPSADYMHGPPPMPHAESPVMMPQNGSGPSLSRTSSSSSNTSAPMHPGHRKHASTSSQDDQPMMHPPHHMRQTSQHSSSSGGSPVMQGPRAPTMPAPGPQDPATATWAAIARGNPKPPTMPVPADMPRHMVQQPPQAMQQASQGSNPIQVRSDHTYSWAPNVNYGAVNVQQMGNARPLHHGAANMQMPMVPRVQQQTILPRQKMPLQGVAGPPKNQAPPQQAVVATSTPEQVELHAPKPEDGKHGRKMTESPSAQAAASTSNTKKQLQEFYRNFKLQNEVGKDAAALHGSSKSTPRQPGPPQQPAGPPNPQQQAYPPGGIPQQPGPPQGAAPAQIPGQGAQQVNHPGPVSHHTQQIPVASPGIHDFAAPATLHSQMPSPGQAAADKSNVAPMRKAKGDNGYASPNIHVAVSQVPQTKAYAVISVSAANVHTIASHPQSTMAGAGHSAQRNQRRSPAGESQVSSPPSAASIPANTESETAESAGAQISLNPEAREFKPRAPGKTVVVTTQPTTQVQPQAPYVPHSQMLSPMHQLVPPAMYHAGQIIDTQGMIYQHTPGVMFPAQPYHHLPQMVSTMPSQQQMQQFAAFENPQQMYQGPGPQPMLHSNARVAMQPNMQPHLQQYAAEQGQHQVYQVPVPQPAYMPPQARPHSAHTPNQGAHATATSPASQPVQQQPPHAVNVNHPAPPPMVQPPPGAQPQMFFVSQSHHPHLGQTPVPAQYITAPMQASASMANVAPQQKGHHPPVSYVPQQYAKYQPPNS